MSHPYVVIFNAATAQVNKFNKSRLASDFAGILGELCKVITTFN